MGYFRNYNKSAKLEPGRIMFVPRVIPRFSIFYKVACLSDAIGKESDSVSQNLVSGVFSECRPGRIKLSVAV